jgi:pyridoxamine 5'-phosphate oxidase
LLRKVFCPKINKKMSEESPHLAPWRSPIARSLYQHRSQPQSRYLQLATVDSTGRPTNRTLVFRGFVDCLSGRSNLLKFISDRRTAKIQHLHTQPWAEACWYFPNTREQFRIAGKIDLVDSDRPDPAYQKLRRSTWHDLSDNARAQFNWLDPGMPLENSSEDSDAAKSVEPTITDPLQPTVSFCLLLLDPELVDRLELRNNPQTRHQYKKDPAKDSFAWLSQAVNP